jgi:hypothetical protein
VPAVVPSVVQLPAPHALASEVAALSAPPAAAAVATSIGAAAPAPAAATAAPVWQPGSIVAIFISDGTADHPNAGLLFGNGYSFTAANLECAGATACDGGNAGLLVGTGGNGRIDASRRAAIVAHRDLACCKQGKYRAQPEKHPTLSAGLRAAGFTESPSQIRHDPVGD